MTEADAIEAISQRWASAWPGLQPTIPFTLENESFDAVDKWARVTVRMTSSRQHTIGPAPNRRFERRGNIFVQLFGALDAGRRPLAQLASDVRTIFEAQSIAGVSGGEPIITYAANTQDVTTDLRWFIVVMIIPFVFYETR